MLLRPWHWRWRHHHGRPGLAGILAAAILLAGGCKNHSRPSLEQRFTEARLQYQRGYTDHAIELAEQGIRDSADQPVLHWRFRVLRAESHTRKGTPAEAVKLLAGDLPPGAPADLIARRHLIQGFAECQLHNYREAENEFSKSAELAGQNAGVLAEILYFRGRCEIVQGNLERAADDFQNAAAAPSVDGFVRAWSLANVGYCLNQAGHPGDAAAWYEKARTASAALQAPVLEEQALGSLGSVYFEVGDLPHAKQASEAAVRMAEELKLTADRQRWLVNLGSAQYNLRESGAAEESWKEALAIPSPPGDPRLIVLSLHNLTRLVLSQNRMTQAEKYHEEERRLVPNGTDLIEWRLDDARILELKGDYRAAEAILRQLLGETQALPANKGPKFRTIWAMQIQLARVYAAQKKDAEATIWFERAIDTIERAARQMPSDHARTTLLSNIPVFDDYVAFLVDRGEKAKSLRVSQQGRAWTLAQGLGLSTSANESPAQWLTRIQRLLRQRKAVVLSYFLSEKECYLWVVTAANAQVFKLGIAGPALEDLIDRYRAEINSHLPVEASSAAQRLFQVLIPPTNATLPKDSHVIIVADSRLYSINFEALVSSQGGLHYWIDDVAVENVSSLDLWMAGSNRRATAGASALVIGAPVQADPHFPALPNAPKEMENVAQYFDANKITKISGGNATPDAYIASSPGNFTYVYFAAHGISNPVDPMDSAIVLSPGRAGTYKLLASQIIEKKLNAELVTVSACEGAGTNLQSLEGLLGLEWAFLRAGAHRVVAGLWDVDDASTPGFMNDFYRDLRHGQDAADALRNAKRAMLHSQDSVHRHPYYWASLQLYTGR